MRFRRMKWGACMSNPYPLLNIPRHPLWIAAYEGACRIAATAQPESLSAVAQTACAVTARYVRPIHRSDAPIASPLSAWVEWQYYRAAGDRTRLAQVLPKLDQRFHAFKAERALPSGLYRGSVTLEALANSPREPGGWVDVTAKQAIEAECLAASGDALGNPEFAEAYRAEWRNLCAQINQFCWDDTLGFYGDLDDDGKLFPEKTIAGFWPLIAGAATPEQARRLAALLADGASFWRVHAVPSLPADHPRYADRGALWRGSVWPLENYAIVQGLERSGYYDLAARLADNHITTLSHVYKETESHWDNYAPDFIEPGSIAQPESPAAGITAIALLLETILGFRVEAPAQTLHWRPWLAETFSVEHLPIGDEFVDMHVTADAVGTLTVSIRATGDLRVHVFTAAGQEWLTVEAKTTTRLEKVRGH